MARSLRAVGALFFAAMLVTAGVPMSAPAGALVTSGPDVTPALGSVEAPVTGFDYIPPVSQVSAGGEFTCAVTTNGGVKCWGNDSYGQLGDAFASGGTSTTPRDVSGLVSGVVAVSAGGHHACALTATGGVKCWGRNDNGQLGDGTTSNRFTPVDVVGLSTGVASISAGGSHTCAVTTTGAVKCWGYNGFGQLGDGTTTARSTPVDVRGLSTPITAVAAAGYGFTCALTALGGVMCWGLNSTGQLGRGTADSSSDPQGVTGLASGVATISAGHDSACAVTTAGAATCWGGNTEGQLGDGTTTARWTPVAVSSLSSGVAAISSGVHYACARTTAGAVKCWGDNATGQLGDGTTLDHVTPVAVAGLPDGVSIVSAGGAHACAFTTSHGTQCWGFNTHGQLGDGTKTSRHSPVGVSSLFSAVSTPISAGGYHTCALTNDGALSCWGRADDGQLGDGTRVNRSLTPVGVSGLSSGVDMVSAGGWHTCAVTTGGTELCWGSNIDGQLGDGTDVDRWTPVWVPELSGTGRTISAGLNAHTCAVDTRGVVFCWGFNNLGQVGDGTETTTFRPVRVSGLSSGARAVRTGGWHTCALTGPGAVMCWGDNTHGQLGNGATGVEDSSPTPVAVTSLSAGVVAISAGNDHTSALTTAGGVRCWGSNGHGQLGDGSTKNRSTPVDVVGLPGAVAAISAGGNHTCALTTSGAAWCWGGNQYGQLGDGTMTDRPSPVAVTGLGKEVASVSGGLHFTCALTTSGLWCWGGNGWGQLGDGTTKNSSTPIAVAGMLPGSSRATATTVASSLNPSMAGRRLTYTATVTPAPNGGTVAFVDNGRRIRGCTAQLVDGAGHATCDVPPPAVGRHVILAVYSGTAESSASTSRPLVQQVSAHR